MRQVFGQHALGDIAQDKNRSTKVPEKSMNYI
jgi:hypothetical protein